MNSKLIQVTALSTLLGGLLLTRAPLKPASAIAQVSFPVKDILYTGASDGIMDAEFTVPDRNTTTSANGGKLRRYDVHIAKMFELTDFECRNQQQRNWNRIVWKYYAGNGNIDMGAFNISCDQARKIATTYGLGQSQLTRVTYYRAPATITVPTLKIVGSKIPVWLKFVQKFPPVNANTSRVETNPTSRQSNNPNSNAQTPTNTLSPQAWENAQLIRTLIGNSYQVNSIAISPDGQTLVSGSNDETTKIWNMQTGELLRTLDFNAARPNDGSRRSVWVTSVAISPDGRILVSSGDDGLVEVWNLKTEDLLYRLPGAGSRVAITPDSQTLASGISDHTVKLWNLRSGELRQVLPGLVQGSARLSMSLDGRIIAAGSMFAKVNLWNLHTGELIRTFGTSKTPRDIISTAISPKGEILITSQEGMSAVKMWNLNTGELIRTLEGHSSQINSVAVSTDGHILATGSADGTVRIVDLRTRELIRVLKDADKVLSVAFSPDSRTLASGSEDGKIRIWQVP